MRPGRTLRLAIVAALAASCAVGASPALAAPSRAPELTPAAHDGLTRALASGELSEAEYALERARSLFGLDSVRARYGSVERAGPHDATLVLRDLLARIPELSPSQRQEARRLVARPTDSPDPFGSTYTVAEAPSSPLCTTHVCVHYVVSSNDAPPLVDSNTNGHPDWIDDAAAELELVWSKEVDAYGYRAPKSDLTSTNHGPDGKLDVYIADVGAERLYGYCTSDDPNATSPSYPYGDISAYCVLDDDYAASQFPAVFGLDAFRVTAAHEFFHAVQAAYDFFDDLVLIEGTATWMEDEVYDEINDNYQYFAASALERPDVPFDLALSGSSSLHGFQYGAFVFYRYLTETLRSPNVIREVWDLADAAPGGSDLYSVAAVHAALQSHGRTFRGMFAGFAAGNAFPANTYEEGASYPTPPVSRRLTISAAQRQGTGVAELDHLTSWYGAFKPGASVAANARLRVTLDLPPRERGSEATLLITAPNGKVTTIPLKIAGSGHVARTVGFGRGKVKGVILVLTNASTRYDCFRGSPLACGGTARDDGLDFRYRVSLVKPR